MNKSDLIDAISDRVGGRQAATVAVESFIDTVTRAVSKGERVAISGFGVFEKTDRAARTGRNPATGAIVKIKKTSVPKFRPGTEFKAYVNGSKKFAKATAASGAAKAAPATRTAPAKKTAPAAKAAPVKAAATKAPAKKTAAAATKAPARATATKAAATKAPAKKTTVAKAPARKVAATKAVKAPAKKTTARKTVR